MELSTELAVHNPKSSNESTWAHYRYFCIGWLADHARCGLPPFLLSSLYVPDMHPETVILTMLILDVCFRQQRHVDRPVRSALFSRFASLLVQKVIRICFSEVFANKEVFFWTIAPSAVKMAVNSGPTATTVDMGNYSRSEMESQPFSSQSLRFSSWFRVV